MASGQHRRPQPSHPILSHSCSGVRVVRTWASPLSLRYIPGSSEQKGKADELSHAIAPSRADVSQLRSGPSSITVAGVSLLCSSLRPGSVWDAIMEERAYTDMIAVGDCLTWGKTTGSRGGSELLDRLEAAPRERAHVTSLRLTPFSTYFRQWWPRRDTCGDDAQTHRPAESLHACSV